MKSKILAIFMIGISTILAGAVNYLYHPLMIRYLDINTLAEFESLISILNILGVITSGIGLFFTKEFSINSGDGDKVKTIFVYFNKIMLGVGFLGFLLFGALSPFFARFLNIDNNIPLILIGTNIIFIFGNALANSFLQGLKKIKYISITAVTNAIAKLIIGVGFVAIGRGLYGALGGYVVGLFFIIVVNYTFIYRTLRNNQIHDNFDEIKNNFKKEFKSIIHFFVLTVSLSVLMNIDIIFAKHLFDSQVAGIYAGLSVVAKFLIFVSGAIETVYYPYFVQNQRHHLSFKQILIPLAVNTVMTLGAIGFFYLFGTKILDIMKPGFGQYLNMFLLLLVYCGIYGVISFYCKIFVGWSNYKVNYILIIGILTMIISFYTYGKNDIYNFTYIIIVVSLLIMIAILTQINAKKSNIKTEKFIK